MSLWHQRVTNAQNGCVAGKPTLPAHLIYKNINPNISTELSLARSPYSTYSYYNQHLNSQQNISIAVDGLVSIETIMALYKKGAYTKLFQLKGDFSFILYDETKKLTLIFRSFPAGYPLYYVAKNNMLSVSTNPVYLLHRDDITGSLDHEEISLLFAFDFARTKGNVFSDLIKIQAGEMIIVTPDKIEKFKKHMENIFVPETYDSEFEVIDKYRSMIEESVSQSLVHGQKHAVMLSSGMDSSTLAMFAKQQLEKEKSSLSAYSWMLPNDSTGDESKEIKLLSNALDIPLKIYNAESFGPFDALENPILVPDTPYVNSYWYMVAEIYRQASDDGVNIMLNGGFGDMLYRGRNTLLVDIIKYKQFSLLIPELNNLVKEFGYSDILKKSPEIRAVLKSIAPDILLKYRRNKKIIKIHPWLSDNAKERVNISLEKSDNILHDNRYKDFGYALSKYQIGSLGIERYLSGQYGIKRIDPYTNMELLNFTRGIPTYMVYRNGLTKYFAREAMKGLLPEYIRLQPRVGILSHILYDSFDRNRGTVKQMLLDDRSSWKTYIDETWMENIFKKTNPDGFELIVLRQSLNLQQWQKAIKPGGSLYEGKFTQRYKR